MKIGILTFWWSNDNYGQLLQCYALQKYLRNAGHDAYLIRYNSQDDYIKTPLFIRILKAFNPALLYRYVKGKTDSKKSIEEADNHDRRFDDFRKKYIAKSEKIYNSYAELKENPPEAGCYIVGSDQIWNFSFYRNAAQCKNRIHAYFLDFGKSDAKRVSYAASWGCISLRKDIIAEIQPLLARFDYVSVREKSGIGLCRKCGYENAELVPDPTLLLGADDWRSIYRENNVSKHEKPYLFLYMLNNEYRFDIGSVYEFAARRGLEVVYVTGNSKIDKHEKCFASIPEWICLADNAEYVITNSFHCGVFSTIFHKRFGIVSLSGRDEGMNTRFETLFALRGTGNRFLKNGFSVLDNKYEAAGKPLDSRILSALE